MNKKQEKKTGGTILIVEDERPIAKALKLKLEKEGFTVDHAADGVEGLEMLKKNKYDVALLDLVMPNADGFSVLAAAKKSKVTTKIVVSSNLNQEQDIEKAKSLGASDFLVKSTTSLQEIVELVRGML